MQAVYSCGSNTPTPSPRLSRKHYGYGQPFMPGYKNTNSNHFGQPVKRKVVKVQNLSGGDANLRDTIPAMRKSVAITCLICNIFFPGLGTLVSGFTIFCGGKIRRKGTTRQLVLKTNSGVALLQFLTAFLFLLGWIWSIMWGAAFLSYSEEYYKTEVKDVESTPEESNQNPATHRAPRANHRRADNTARRSLPAAIFSALPTVSSRETEEESMIALQEAPIVVQPAPPQQRSQPIINCVNPRHQRILLRRMSETDFSPALLSERGLEEIIVHDLPVLNGATNLPGPSAELDPKLLPDSNR